MTRSPILAASVRYWAWLGETLADWAQKIGGPKRRRSVFIFGGCLTWLIVGLVYVVAVAVIATMLLGLVAALALVGVLLSAAGGVDQLRLDVMRTRRSAPTV